MIPGEREWNELMGYKDNIPAEEQRIGNADRDEAVDFLAQRVATGHLTQADFDARRDRALTAVTKMDLTALTTDLPPLPQAAPQTYQLQSWGNAYPFSLWRWGGSLILAAAMIVLPGPLTAAAYGGFDHGPLTGGMAVLLIVGGVFLLLFAGIGFAPDGRKPIQSHPKYEKKYRNGTPGGRNY